MRTSASQVRTRPSVISCILFLLVRTRTGKKSHSSLSFFFTSLRAVLFTDFLKRPPGTIWRLIAARHLDPAVVRPCKFVHSVFGLSSSLARYTPVMPPVLGEFIRPLSTFGHHPLVSTSLSCPIDKNQIRPLRVRVAELSLRQPVPCRYV